MSNKVLAILSKVEHGVVLGAEDSIHAVTVIGEGAADLIKILSTAKTISPQVSLAITKLVGDAEALATTAVSIGATKGLDIASDVQGAAQVETIVSDTLALLPLIKQALSAVEADVK